MGDFDSNQVAALKFYYAQFKNKWKKYEEVAKQRNEKRVFLKESLSSERISNLTEDDVTEIIQSLWTGTLFPKKIVRNNKVESIKNSFKFLLYGPGNPYERLEKIFQDPQFTLKNMGPPRISELLGKVLDISIVNGPVESLAERLGYKFTFKEIATKEWAEQYDEFVKKIQKTLGVESIDQTDFLIYFIEFFDEFAPGVDEPLPRFENGEFMFVQEDFASTTGTAADARFIRKRMKLLHDIVKEQLSAKFPIERSYVNHYMKRPIKGQDPRYYDITWSGFVTPEALVKRPQESVQFQITLTKDFVSADIWISFVGKEQLNKAKKIIENSKEKFLELLKTTVPPEHYIGVYLRHKPDSDGMDFPISEINREKIDKLLVKMDEDGAEFALGPYWDPQDVINCGRNIVQDITTTFTTLLPAYNYLIGKEALQSTSTMRIPTGNFSRFEKILLKKKQIIFYGPPGTGKTYEALEFAKDFSGYTNSKYFRTVTFHPSYSYEEFVEGIKPRIDTQTNQVVFDIEDGIFKEICIDAMDEQDQNFVLVIDELNRGNISKIFGELISLIENDKRLGARMEMKVNLAYSKKEFAVPQNVYIIGTMNTSDRSLVQIDLALRRRFGFVEFMPDYSMIQKEIDGFSLAKLLENLNKLVLKHHRNREQQIGHTYFMIAGNAMNKISDVKFAFETEIIPLLQEYFYNDYSKLVNVLGPNFIDAQKQEIKSLTDDEFRQALNHILEYD